jgi:hypothetical protein
MELLNVLIYPLLESNPNLPFYGLKMKVLVVEQERTLLGAQRHERRTGVRASLAVRRSQEDLQDLKCLRQSLRTFNA